MLVCPRAISCDLICKSATLPVQEHQNPVIKTFANFQNGVACYVIIELIRVNLLDHIAADSWVMRVGDNFASKENLDERICKAYTDGINEDITRLKSEGFRADFVVGDELPKKRPTWIVFSMHGLVCLKIDELQVISFDVYLSAKLFLD